jgi:parvulin-like peptidyl-prolyl isomerase
LESAKRGDDATRELMNKLRTDLLAGADFAGMAREYSDDRASAPNGGRVGWTSRADVNYWLDKSVASLDKVGDVSEVLPTKSGYYIVRLDGRKRGRQQTFDEVKDGILAKMKEQHVAARRDAKNESIYTDPALRVNQAAVDALLTPADPEATRKALRALESQSN